MNNRKIESLKKFSGLKLKGDLISIILPVYNGGHYLSMSIESCLNQTYENIELIIINDCSTDNSLEIANTFSKIDSRVKVYSNIENKKLPASLNIGHRIAKGDFITWTSDDNVFELNALEELLKTLVINEADVVYGDFSLIDQTGNLVGEVKLLGIENIIFSNCIGCCFLYKEEVFVRNGGFDESLFLVEDYDFWLRAIFHSRYFQVKKTLYNYRSHGESLTNQISIDRSCNQQWQVNVKKMYLNFYKTLLNREYDKISELAFKSLTHQKINFDWFKKNTVEIKILKEKLKNNVNFSNSQLLERVFLNKIVQVMKNNHDSQSNFLKSFYIIQNYIWVIDKKTLKILIKYSFFKKKFVS